MPRDWMIFNLETEGRDARRGGNVNQPRGGGGPNYGAVNDAYRRIFGERWDRMTEEERRSIMMDEDLQARMEARQQMGTQRRVEERAREQIAQSAIEQRRRENRARAFNQERAMANPRNVSPGAFTWG